MRLGWRSRRAPGAGRPRRCRSAARSPVAAVAVQVARTAATGGSSRTRGAAGPAQLAAIGLDQRRPSRRRGCSAPARTVRKCRLLFGRSMPAAAARCSGTLAAARRSTIESLGSPSRSSSREPKRSRIAGRKSIQRGGRGDHVDAVGQAAGGDVGDHRLQVLELAAQRRPAVDHQEHVAERVVGDPAVGPRGRRYVGHRVDALLGERAAPARPAASATSPTVRRTAAASSRPATPPTCGRSAQRGQRAAAEVEAVDLHLGRGVGERQRRRSACAARCDLPLCGAADDRDVPGRAGQVAATARRAAARTACRRARPAPAARRAAPGWRR